MANFESGVAGYVRGTATVEVFFPVDAKGNADINCYQCEFFHRSTSRCGLNGKVCAYPQKYVGQFCPLEMEEEHE